MYNNRELYFASLTIDDLRIDVIGDHLCGDLGQALLCHCAVFGECYGEIIKLSRLKGGSYNV